ncbi:MAG: hypothetical protein HYX57_11705 [Chloroflexi bacterium]|nr:hypothetical protein [Chloroflexota bacterium]
MSWHPDASGSAPPQSGEGDAGTSTPGSAAGPGEPEPSRNRRALSISILAVLGMLVVAALASGRGAPAGSATFPPAGVTAGPAGDVVEATRGDVIRALAAQGIQAEAAVTPYRPAEAAGFASAPRILVHAILAADVQGGLILIYEFPSPGAATAAATEQAAYIASGIGRVQFPTDSRFVIRVVGSTVVFFTWSPSSSPDSGTAAIAEALATLGVGVPVPN